MTDHINTIELDGVMPRVFRGDESATAGSDVWLSHLQLRRGKAYAVSAASGRGKSSMLSFIYGLRNDYDGEIKFDGVSLRELVIADRVRLRRGSLAFMPQDMGLFAELTAMENIHIKSRLTPTVTDDFIREKLDALGIDNIRDRRCGMMSLGQQQRVALVRTLCQDFDFLLLDEPVSHLDRANNEAMGRLVADEVRRRGAGLIVTSVGVPLVTGLDTTVLML